jgi:hypothetical protein
MRFCGVASKDYPLSTINPLDIELQHSTPCQARHRIAAARGLNRQETFLPILLLRCSSTAWGPNHPTQTYMRYCRSYIQKPAASTAFGTEDELSLARSPTILPVCYLLRTSVLTEYSVPLSNTYLERSTRTWYPVHPSTRYLLLSTGWTRNKTSSIRRIPYSKRTKQTTGQRHIVTN